MVFSDSGTYNQLYEWLCADLMQDCDACRTMNRQCERGDAGNRYTGDCNSCIETGSLCDTSLACLNIARPHYVLQDYQMQLMLLEQHNKKRLLRARQEQDTMGQSSSQPSHNMAMATSSFPFGNHALRDHQMQLMLLEQQNRLRLLRARQEQDTIGQSSSQSFHNMAMATSSFPFGNHALQDYQMQLMLLEQQKKKRLLMAQQQTNGVGLPPSHIQPSSSGGLQLMPWVNTRQDYEMQITDQCRDCECLLRASQARVDEWQNSSSDPSQPALDNSAPLPEPRHVEQSLKAQNDLGASIREVQAQPVIASSPLSPLPAPTAQASGHPDQCSELAAPSQDVSGAAPALE